jgi:starch phosphorylase
MAMRIDAHGTRSRSWCDVETGQRRTDRRRALGYGSMPFRTTIPTQPIPDHRLPPALEGLTRLAYNMYWSWHPEVRELFARIDRRVWHNFRSPVAVLRIQRDWTTLVEDVDFMVRYQTILGDFDTYMANGHEHWFARIHGGDISGPVAYFCAEYGLQESVPIYSGGLGVLAGDHCKTASDMALPFVAVGLFYRRGYFRQTIDADGHQQHEYLMLDPARLPLLRAIDRLGEPLTVGVELPGRTVYAAVWLAQVGRVPLLLLDTDIPENTESDRPISHILYVRGREMRLHQELVLGIGGVRALRQLDIQPSVWHLNEGHSAFMLMEQARELVLAGNRLDDALAQVRSHAVFTIHTPVPAGNERFSADLVRELIAPELAASGIDSSAIIEMGRGVDGSDGQFDMTAFALRNTSMANGVSQLHGKVANDTWSAIIDHSIVGITNGVHPPTWVGRPLRAVMRGLGADLDHLEHEDEEDAFWERLDQVRDEDLWRAHLEQKAALQEYARIRLRRQFARHGEAPSMLAELSDILDPNVLTVGFARRMATYKRAALLFSDIERLVRLTTNPERPVQFVFAGKAHPADRPGQGVIQTIFEHSRSQALRGRVFILEDYDMRVARHLVQGVDVWLNNPRRPLEASGTSGMKAAMNGVVNVSILDGWWDEGYRGDNGWAIGGRDPNPDEGAQDWADAQDLYRLLEDQIVPLWYELDTGGMPHGWLARMRNAVRESVWEFSTTRMLAQYVEEMYLPAARALAPARSA